MNFLLSSGFGVLTGSGLLLASDQLSSSIRHSREGDNPACVAHWMPYYSLQEVFVTKILGMQNSRVVMINNCDHSKVGIVTWAQQVRENEQLTSESTIRIHKATTARKQV